jgi:hypothetical protein
VFEDDKFVLKVYISGTSRYTEDDLVWEESELYYNFNETNYRAKNVTIPYAQIGQQMWMHSNLISDETILKARAKVIIYEKPFREQTYNLISGEAELSYDDSSAEIP